MELNGAPPGLPPPEQFLRRRVGPRRSTRRSFRSLARRAAAAAGLAGVTAAGFWTATAAGRAPELNVARIVMEGNQRLSEGEILVALGLSSGSNILGLNLGALKQQMLRSTWVKDVEVARVLPGTLTLRVVERVPVGIAVLDRLYLMDEEGAFLDELGPRYRDLALPLVRGLGKEPRAPGAGTPGAMEERAPGERARAAGRALAALGRDRRLEEAVSEIDVSDRSGSLRLVLRHPPLTVLCAEKNLVQRLSEILPIAEELERRFPAIEAVDLRFSGRAYLRLGPSEVAEAGERTVSDGR